MHIHNVDLHLQIQSDAKSLANDRDNFKLLYEQVSHTTCIILRVLRTLYIHACVHIRTCTRDARSRGFESHLRQLIFP